MLEHTTVWIVPVHVWTVAVHLWTVPVHVWIVPVHVWTLSVYLCTVSVLVSIDSTFFSIALIFATVSWPHFLLVSLFFSSFSHARGLRSLAFGCEAVLQLLHPSQFSKAQAGVVTSHCFAAHHLPSPTACGAATSAGKSNAATLHRYHFAALLQNRQIDTNLVSASRMQRNVQACSTRQSLSQHTYKVWPAPASAILLSSTEKQQQKTIQTHKSPKLI